MRRSRLAVVAATVVGVAGFTAAATVAGDQKRSFETDLNGFEEVPSVSTTGGGQVDAEVSRDGTEMRYTLRYRNLEGAVLQSHIHFGQEGVNGGIVVFLCSNLGNGTVRTPACPPPPAEVTGVLTAEDVSTTAAAAGARTQGIGEREFDEFVRAMRAGVTYANVHSDRWPGGEIRGQFDQRGHQED
jgi:CHRD domain